MKEPSLDRTGKTKQNSETADQEVNFSELAAAEQDIQEPSVLDYLKSVLMPWKGKPLAFPSMESSPVVAADDSSETIETTAQEPKVNEGGLRIPWRTILSIPFALLAQRTFAPPGGSHILGIMLLIGTVSLSIWGVLSKEWILEPHPHVEKSKDNLKVRWVSLLIGLVLAALTAFVFWAFGKGEFNFLNLSLLLASLIFLLHAFWRGRPEILDLPVNLTRWIQNPQINLKISSWGLLILAAIALVVFFRLYHLDQVPPEMVSDHAEKFLDVNDIFSGNTRIFFSRNGGREALQFYLLAFLMRYLGAPANHLTLKISTVLIGLMALPYVYLLGKEISNRRVALIAFTFAGFAYWTNVVARAGMRLPFYMFFSAALIYHLLRGLHRGDRNHFIMAGIFLGLSFYGYSADRVLPLLVIVAIGLFIVHRQSRGFRKQTAWQTIVLALFAFIVFLPLFHYILYDPTGFSQRMMSRMSGTEQPLPGPAFLIFLDNLWQALRMFSWSGGVVWGVSIPNNPVLGTVTGGIFYLGVALVLLRYLRNQNWMDIFLILAIPVLMLPSIMALAFPSENPSLYRTGGAMVPVFLLIGIALDSIMTTFEHSLRRPWGRALAWGTLAVLTLLAARQDYQWVFDKYYQQYRQSAWNYSEMGDVIQSFSRTIGSPDTAWVMGYPHWADTRLVAIEAGYPQRDYAMFVDGLENTITDRRPKLFLLNPQDQEAKEALPRFYPDGWFRTYESSVDYKDFVLFFAPPSE